MATVLKPDRVTAFLICFLEPLLAGVMVKDISNPLLSDWRTAQLLSPDTLHTSLQTELNLCQRCFLFAQSHKVYSVLCAGIWC
jgi:hypothetical protein